MNEKLRHEDEQYAVEYLEKDFDQCFNQMRHYDDQIFGIVKYVFTAYTALIGSAIALFQISIEKGINLIIAAKFGLSVGLIVGVFVFYFTVRNRVYFVFVARYINEHRRLFLSKKPLGFENRTRMYVDPTQPPFFNWLSSQAWLMYIIAFLNAALLSILLFMIMYKDNRWFIIIVGGVILFLFQLFSAIIYLDAREKKSANKAVFGKENTE